MIFDNRCGKCTKFPGNNQKCIHDAFKRNKIYANDYECVNTVKQ